MKKITLLMLLALSTLLSANEAELKAKIGQLPMLKSIGATITKVTLANDIYLIRGEVKGKRGGKLEAFVTKDFKNLVVGKVYNINTKKELIMPLDINVTALKKIAAFKMGTGKDEYFIFTDPECPYCQRLEKEIHAHTIRKNVTVYKILFPLSFHKHSKSMTRYIFSQKDDKASAKAMFDIANKSTKYKDAKYSDTERSKYNKMIQSSIAAGNRAGISGTPTLVNAKGEKVSPSMIFK